MTSYAPPSAHRYVMWIVNGKTIRAFPAFQFSSSSSFSFFKRIHIKKWENKMRRHWIDCCRMDPNYRSTPLHSVLFVVYISFHVDCLLLAADLLFILETSAWRHIRIPAKSAQTSPVWSACVSSSVGTNVRRPLNGSTAQQLSGRVLCAPLPLSIRIMYCIHCRWKGKGEAIWPISIDTFGVATHYERAHKFFSLFFHYFSYFFFYFISELRSHTATCVFHHSRCGE